MAKVKIMIHANNAMKQQDPSFVCGRKESLEMSKIHIYRVFPANIILIGEESLSLLYLMISIIHIFEYQ